MSVTYTDYQDAVEGIDEVDSAVENTQEQASQTSKITTFLRWSGSIIILLSAFSFLLQGHADLLPAYRYWIAMGFIILLTGCGLVCAYAFKETKGTRIFFALAMVFLPIQVSQVSAMIYSYMHGAMAAIHPVVAWWQFSNVTPALMLVNLILTGLLSVPLIYAGFSILARRHRRQFSLVFYTVCVLLLLPVRDPYLIPVMLAAMLLYLRKINISVGNDSVMKLSEGLAARAIVWVPAVILIGRSFLYPMSFLLPVVLLVFAAQCLIIDIKRATQSTKLVILSESAGVMALLTAWFFLAIQLSGAVQLSLLMLPGCLILFLLSEQVVYFGKFYRTIAALLAVFICYTIDPLLWLYAPVLSIAVGVLLIVAGIQYREKVSALAGLVCFSVGCLSYFHYAVYFYQTSPWLSTIALGLCVLLLASYLENKEKQILKKTKLYFNEFKSWN